MASPLSHSDKTHESACYVALNTWQQAVTPGVSQATVKAADIAYYRAVIASCKARGIEYGTFRQALVELGQGGS